MSIYLKIVYVAWCIVAMALAMYGLRSILISGGQDFALGAGFGFFVATVLLLWAGKIS